MDFFKLNLPKKRLLFKYQVDWKGLVNSSQGDNKEEIEKAQRLLNEVQTALADSEAKAHAAAEALRRAKEASYEAKKSEEGFFTQKFSK